MSRLKILCRFIPKHSRDIRTVRSIIGRMAIAVIDHDLRKIERRHSFKTGGVYSKLIRVRATFVMRVYSANGAEIMFCDARVELIAREFLRTACEFEL